MSEHPLAVTSQISFRIYETVAQWRSLMDRTQRQWADDDRWCAHCAEAHYGVPVANSMFDAQARLTYGLEWMINRSPKEWSRLLPQFDRWMEKGMRHNPGALYAFMSQDKLVTYSIWARVQEMDAAEDITWVEAAPSQRLRLSDDMPEEFCNPDCLCGLMEVWESTHHEMSAMMLREADTLRLHGEGARAGSDEQWLSYQAVAHIVAAARRTTLGLLNSAEPHCSEERRFKPRVPIYEAFDQVPGVAPAYGDSDTIDCSEIEDL